MAGGTRPAASGTQDTQMPHSARPALPRASPCTPTRRRIRCPPSHAFAHPGRLHGQGGATGSRFRRQEGVPGEIQHGARRGTMQGVRSLKGRHGIGLRGTGVPCKRRERARIGKAKWMPAGRLPLPSSEGDARDRPWTGRPLPFRSRPRESALALGRRRARGSPKSRGHRPDRGNGGISSPSRRSPRKIPARPRFSRGNPAARQGEACIPTNPISTGGSSPTSPSSGGEARTVPPRAPDRPAAGTPHAAPNGQAKGSSPSSTADRRRRRAIARGSRSALSAPAMWTSALRSAPCTWSESTQCVRTSTSPLSAPPRRPTIPPPPLPMEDFLPGTLAMREESKAFIPRLRPAGPRLPKEAIVMPRPPKSVAEARDVTVPGREGMYAGSQGMPPSPHQGPRSRHRGPAHAPPILVRCQAKRLQHAG